MSPTERRDFDANPYSDAEQRIAEFFFKLGTGGGDDPAGALIASHQWMASERTRLIPARLSRRRRSEKNTAIVGTQP